MATVKDNYPYSLGDITKTIPPPKMKKEKKEKIENKFLEEVQKELGYVSSLFMSQKCKGTEIVMPTKELEEVSDRIGLYLFELLAQEKQKWVEEIEKRLPKEQNKVDRFYDGFDYALGLVRDILEELKQRIKK